MIDASSNIPKHVAIIMDGNGRWAQERGKNRIFGHRTGKKAVQNIVETAAKHKIDYLTLYAFSTENWKRPPLEVNTLMDLLIRSLKRELKQMLENNIRLQSIGALESFLLKFKKHCSTPLNKPKTTVVWC